MAATARQSGSATAKEVVSGAASEDGGVVIKEEISFGKALTRSQLASSCFQPA